MTIGKPFAKPSEAQRAAFGALLKKDIFEFLGDVSVAGLGAAAAHLDAHPESVITQTAKHPFIKAAMRTAVEGVVSLKEEAAAKARADAQKAVEEAKGKVVDAEFEEEPKPKEAAK